MNFFSETNRLMITYVCACDKMQMVPLSGNNDTINHILRSNKSLKRE